MTDAKVNMSLDDIIKMNKKAAFPKKSQGATRGGRGGRGTGRGGAARGGGAGRAGPTRGAARGGAVRGARGGKFGGASRRGVSGGRTMTFVNKRVAAAGTARATAATNAQTKKLVNALVKKALRTRLGGAVAARPLAAANRGVAVGRVGGILSRLNTRSRVITKRAPVIAQPVVHTVQTVRRGRGFRAAPVEEELYDDEEEIVQPVVIQRPRIRPARPSVVVERVVEAPRIQRVVQPARQRVIVQQRPIRQRVIQRAQQQPIRQRIQQRVIQRPQQQRQRVIVVERPAPVQRVQKVIQRVQRPQFVRQRQQQPRTEVVQYVQARNRKNNNFRNAMGLGGGRRYEEVQVERFEPSSSFLNRNIVRRGRGFQNY